MPSNGRYRILSLDGGGSWALIEVRALLALYGDISGHDVLAKFDLVVSNSGGSIVSAALAGGWKLSEILGLFTDAARRTQIFVALPWYDEVGRVIGLGPKYSTNGKIGGLRAVFGSAPTPVADVPLLQLPALIGLPTQFLIVGFDYDQERARFFRSNANSPAGTFSTPDTTTTLALAVHASSNAPINYFDEPAKFSGWQFWDGAISGYNNPVLAGVLELLASGVARDAIDVLSLGTGNVALPSTASGPAADPAFVQGPRIAGLPRVKDDILVLATSIVDDPPDASSFHAHLALTQRLPADAAHPVTDGPIVRMNPLVRPVRDAQGAWVAPQLNPGGAPQADLADLKTLINLDMDATADSEVALIQKLADAWLVDNVPNQPVRWRRDDDVGCEIGQDRFGAARTLWLARCP
jgi:uncharacterized protein